MERPDLSIYDKTSLERGLVVHTPHSKLSSYPTHLVHRSAKRDAVALYVPVPAAFGWKAVVNLPLVDRNFTEILGLTAGTNTNIVDATQLGAGSQEIRANGARSGDNNFMLKRRGREQLSSTLAADIRRELGDFVEIISYRTVVHERSGI